MFFIERTVYCGIDVCHYGSELYFIVRTLSLFAIFVIFVSENKRNNLLNLDEFDIRLNTEYIGRNFIYSEEADSTNTVLLDKSFKINSNGSVFFAERQNKGRGRLDRTWYSTKEMNLTFSILLTKKSIPKTPSLLNFAASLSIAYAIENLYQFKIDLKWPNDVLINGKKIAGILLESISEGNKLERLVIGMGINVNQTIFQGIFILPPTSIKLELGQPAEREKLLSEILNNFEQLHEILLKNPARIIKEWKAKCGMIGDKVSIVEGEDSREGIFEDVDENGFLLLKRNNRIERIHFGDVSLR